MLLLNNNQVLGALGDVDNAIFGDHGHILNSDTESAGQINAGFCGTQSACGHRACVAGIGIGGFVDLQAQAMTVAVTEVFAITGIRNDLAGSGIDVTANDTGAGCGNTGLLSLQNGLIDLATIAIFSWSYRWILSKVGDDNIRMLKAGAENH